MTNHVHLLAVPGQPDSLARTMRRTQAAYSQRRNRRHGSRSGQPLAVAFLFVPSGG